MPSIHQAQKNIIAQKQKQHLGDNDPIERDTDKQLAGQDTWYLQV